MKKTWSFIVENHMINIVNQAFKEEIFCNGELVAQRKSFLQSFSSELNHVITTSNGEEKKIKVKITAGFFKVYCEAFVDGKTVELDTTGTEITPQDIIRLILFLGISVLIGWLTRVGILSFV